MADLSPILQDEAVKARFWAKALVLGPDECWPWLGSVDRFGRGKFWLPGGGKHYFAPRLVLMMLDGRVRLPEEFACHTCDNPGCVNPDHLWWGSRSDNMKDCGNKGRHGFQTTYRGAANPQAKLNDAAVRDIRSRYNSGDLPGVIAKDYGTISSNIWKIATGRSWSHVK